MRVWFRSVLIAQCVLLCCGSAAFAQDLFELEVFSAETRPAGRYDVEFHSNVLSRGGVSELASGNHRPAHLSVEVARGWTDRFETAVFLQAAPFGNPGSARFAGGHVRAQAALGELSQAAMRFAVGAEYAFNRMAFDGELQTLELRGVVDYSRGRLLIAANPSVEFVTRGAGEGGPVFDVSAKGAWRVASRVSLTGEYFSAAAETRHLEPDLRGHHLTFAGTEVDAGSGWELGLGIGRCVTGSGPWLVKSIVGYRF